jgi:hypothetical protein
MMFQEVRFEGLNTLHPEANQRKHDDDVTQRVNCRNDDYAGQLMVPAWK